MPHIYLIPGLGADHRLFHKLIWKPGQTVSALDWIEPIEAESIQAYALRMCGQIDSNKPFILLGVSLGGIVAIEMAKIIHPEKIILVSSIKNRREKPFYYALGKYLNITVWPSIHHTWLFAIMVRVFFGKMNKEEFLLFRDMISHASHDFLVWSQKAIATWDNMEPFPNLYHIHGTADRAFPPLFIKNYVPVLGGNHYMIVNNAAQISTWLDGIL